MNSQNRYLLRIHYGDGDDASGSGRDINAGIPSTVVKRVELAEKTLLGMGQSGDLSPQSIAVLVAMEDVKADGKSEKK